MMRDPYEILGLAGNASQREIKKRYRLLSKQFHPDLNQNDPEAEAMFKEIQSAYEALSGKQSHKEGIDGSAAPGTKNSFDPADWSGKPFGGFFSAMSAYAKRSRSQKSRKNAGVTERFSQNGGA
jgi:DnaJ-class molecular chaperone